MQINDADNLIARWTLRYAACHLRFPGLLVCGMNALLAGGFRRFVNYLPGRVAALRVRAPAPPPRAFTTPLPLRCHCCAICFSCGGALLPRLLGAYRCR